MLKRNGRKNMALLMWIAISNLKVALNKYILDTSRIWNIKEMCEILEKVPFLA